MTLVSSFAKLKTTNMYLYDILFLFSTFHNTKEAKYNFANGSCLFSLAALVASAHTVYRYTLFPGHSSFHLDSHYPTQFYFHLVVLARNICFLMLNFSENLWSKSLVRPLLQGKVSHPASRCKSCQALLARSELLLYIKSEVGANRVCTIREYFLFAVHTDPSHTTKSAVKNRRKCSELQDAHPQDEQNSRCVFCVTHNAFRREEQRVRGLRTRRLWNSWKTYTRRFSRVILALKVHRTSNLKKTLEMFLNTTFDTKHSIMPGNLRTWVCSLQLLVSTTHSAKKHICGCDLSFARLLRCSKTTRMLNCLYSWTRKCQVSKIFEEFVF